MSAPPPAPRGLCAEMPRPRGRGRESPERTGAEKCSRLGALFGCHDGKSGRRELIARSYATHVWHPFCCSFQSLRHQPPKFASGHLHHHAPASSGICSPIGRGLSTAAYPLCARCLSAAGHITTSPPSAISAPPNQTQRTRGLNVTRISAPSAPRTPARTTYTSCLNDPMIPTSVDGSNVGTPRESTCCRFSLVMTPAGFPSRVTSSAIAVTSRFRTLYREIP